MDTGAAAAVAACGGQGGEGGEGGGTGETRLTVAEAAAEERVELTAAGERLVGRGATVGIVSVGRHAQHAHAKEGPKGYVHKNNLLWVLKSIRCAFP